jgi:hypothetical protein
MINAEKYKNISIEDYLLDCKEPELKNDIIKQ